MRAEAWPDPANADELHDALVWLGFLTEAEAQAGAGWGDWLAELAARKARHAAATPGGDALDRGRALCRCSRRSGRTPRSSLRSSRPRRMPSARGRRRRPWSKSCAAGWRARDRSRRPRSRLRSDWSRTQIAAALAALEAEGFAMRGRFTPGANDEEWCERRLLARIHRYTVKRLRAEIEPVAARDFLRFLFAWQHVDARTRAWKGRMPSRRSIGQLEGFEAPAGAWETEILPARLADYEPAWLDEQCLAGRVAWARLSARNRDANGSERASRTGAHDADYAAGAPAVPLWTSLSAQADAMRPSAARTDGGR